MRVTSLQQHGMMDQTFDVEQIVLGPGQGRVQQGRAGQGRAEMSRAGCSRAGQQAARLNVTAL